MIGSEQEAFRKRIDNKFECLTHDVNATSADSEAQQLILHGMKMTLKIEQIV